MLISRVAVIKKKSKKNNELKLFYAAVLNKQSLLPPANIIYILIHITLSRHKENVVVIDVDPSCNGSIFF